MFKEELSRGGPGDLWQSQPMKKVFLALVRKSVWSLAGWLPSDSSRHEHFWVLFVFFPHFHQQYFQVETCKKRPQRKTSSNTYIF